MLCVRVSVRERLKIELLNISGEYQRLAPRRATLVSATVFNTDGMDIFDFPGILYMLSCDGLI